MIQRLSDEQKYDLVRDFEKTLINAGTKEIAHATSDFLCGINTADRFYIPQLDKMQESLNDMRTERDNYFDEMRELRLKGLKMQEEIERLTEKHERLVKGLKEIRWYDAKDIYEGDESMVGKDWIKRQDVIALIESEGE